MLSTYGKSRKTFTLSLGILPKIRKCVPLFWRFFIPIRYISQKFENVLAFPHFPRKSFPTGILPKFWRAFRFCRTFSEKFPHNWYIAKKSESVLAFSELFSKICPTSIFPEFLKAFRFFGTFFKKLYFSTDDYQKKYPKRSHPFPTFCRKIFISLPAISPTWSDLCAILSLNLPPGKWWAVPPA